jgi:glyoxylase-like metal-dependent hydrolase (beta-lactamase superfamily II)
MAFEPGQVSYTRGLHQLGNGLYAYLQPDGGWGMSNSGLIRDGDQSLLIDTMIDAPLTRAMLDAIQDATGLKTTDIKRVVNTHGDGDHTNGNFLLKHAEIIASEAAARDMANRPPQHWAEFKKKAASIPGEHGEFLREITVPFDFGSCELFPPTRTFSGELRLKVGDKDIHLIQVGPAHTEGDVLVYCPQDRVVFTGDILFINGTPIMWTGPVRGWINACERIMALDVDIVVPGHGPVTDKRGAAQVRDYLMYVDREARKRYDAGLSVAQAVEDIPLGQYEDWIDGERIVVNVQRLYDEYSGSSPGDRTQLFEMMAKIHKQSKGKHIAR